MNLLVALLTDIYGKITSRYKGERFKAKCKLIQENEVLFNRDEIFKNTKYIVKAELEKIENDNEDWQGMVKTITNTFKSVIDEEHHKTESNFKFLKNKIRMMANQLQSQDVANNDIKRNYYFSLFFLENMSQMVKVMDELKSLQQIVMTSSNKEEKTEKSPEIVIEDSEEYESQKEEEEKEEKHEITQEIEEVSEKEQQDQMEIQEVKEANDETENNTYLFRKVLRPQSRSIKHVDVSIKSFPSRLRSGTNAKSFLHK